MRRRNGIFSTIFIAIFIASFLGDFLIDGVATVLALGIICAPFVGLWFFISAIMKGVNKGQDRRVRTTRSNVRYAGGRASTSVANSRVKNISNAALTRIDRKLSAYFKDNMSLSVVDSIALTTQRGIYTTVDELYLTYKDEKILKLLEFKNEYPEIYNNIVDLLIEFSKQKTEVLQTEVKIPSAEPKKESKLSDAEKYIDKINSLNEAIPDEEITNSLYQTCELLRSIDLANKKTNKDEKLTKLYDYYLPILTDILENYKKLSESPVRGDEFEKCETQLRKTIILINQALKTLYASFHEEDYMNLNADITTLQSLLQKDGLVENNPFSRGER